MNFNLDGEKKKKTSIKGKCSKKCNDMDIDFEYLKFLNETIMKDDVLD